MAKGAASYWRDKKGKNEKRFYKSLIKQAEQIYDLYLERKE
jgi:hypothetical protein